MRSASWVLAWARALSFSATPSIAVLPPRWSPTCQRMRANHLGHQRLVWRPTAADLNFNTLTPAAITPCVTPTACTMNELARRDWEQWRVEYRQRSPGAAAYLQWDPADTRYVTVSVAWPEPQSVADPDPNALCNRINLRLGVAIPANYRCFETAVFP